MKRISPNIVNDHLPKCSLEVVAHYTKIGTLQHFLPDKCQSWASAFATPVQFLNDRKELSLGLELLLQVANTNNKSKTRVTNILLNLLDSVGRLETDAFQMSFSGNTDELGQWRGYAANGMGCSVVVDPSKVREAGDIAGWVIYEDEDQRKFANNVLSGLQDVPDDKKLDSLGDVSINDDIAKVLITAASFMKHKGFSSEMEFRLLKFPDSADVKFRETGDRLVPFIDVFESSPQQMIKVIIGPGWQLANLSAAELARNHVVQGIHRLFEARGLSATGIESSNIPYDPR